MTADGQGDLAAPDEWTPAFAGQRRPFAPGNQAALHHGAWSPGVVEPIADRLLADAVAEVPYLAEPRYGPALRAWARAEAQAQLISTYLEERGVLDDEGSPRPAEAALHRAETRAATRRNELGLTPASAARIGRDLAAARGGLDLAVLMSTVDEGGGDA